MHTERRKAGKKTPMYHQLMLDEILSVPQIPQWFADKSSHSIF